VAHAGLKSKTNLAPKVLLYIVILALCVMISTIPHGTAEAVV